MIITHFEISSCSWGIWQLLTLLSLICRKKDLGTVPNRVCTLEQPWDEMITSCVIEKGCLILLNIHNIVSCNWLLTEGCFKWRACIPRNTDVLNPFMLLSYCNLSNWFNLKWSTQPDKIFTRVFSDISRHHQYFHHYIPIDSWYHKRSSSEGKGCLWSDPLNELLFYLPQHLFGNKFSVIKNK